MTNIDILKNNILFKNCSNDEIKVFSKYLIDSYCKKNNIIYSENDIVSYIYIIITGKIELNLSLNSEKTHTICQLGENNVFGIGEIFHEKHYLNAITLEDSHIVQIKKSVFFKYFITNPNINSNILTDFSNIIKLATTRKKWEFSKNQILLYFANLCREDKCNVNKKYFLTIEQNQDEIAHILNLSREQVSRVVSELKEAGVIKINKKEAIIDKDKIESMCIGLDMIDNMRF